MKRTACPSWLHLLALTAKLLLASMFVYAQNDYVLLGSAEGTSQSDCYVLTPDRIYQNGAIWNKKTISLSKSFELEFTLNFGVNLRGAEGIVMVMQTTGTQVRGVGGDGLGYEGIQSSLGLEFDTYRHSSLGDPAEDHLSILRDGVTDHKKSMYGSPVPISATQNNVKDGKDHFVKVRWDAARQVISVHVDCALRISQRVDLLNDVFKGAKEVYWGFTAATGGGRNAHSVCIPRDAISLDTLEACPGESLTLVSSQSTNGQYTWTPARGLDNPAVRTPVLVAETSQLYTVSYQDRCSASKTDSVFVKVNSPAFTLGGPKTVCENENLVLNPALENEPAAPRFKWSTGDTTRQLKPSVSGLYTLEITAGSCTARNSALVRFNPVPQLEFVRDSVFDCPQGELLSLNARASGPGLQYSWNPGGSTDSVLQVSTAGQYRVRITADGGCFVERNFVIRDNCAPAVLVFVPDAFTPNGDGINDVFDWKSTDAGLETRVTIYNRWGEVLFFSETPGDYWDGTWKGIPCPASSYAWKFEYRTKSGDSTDWILKRGEVLLMR